MTDSLLSSDAETQKRRSTRIVQAFPITVTGVDALGQPFKERTTTVMVNCHGCKYQSKHYVPKNSVVTLDIPRVEQDAGPRSVVGRVIWVQRPRTVRELFQIGLEFDVPGNVWGIAFPPEDWFPLPDSAPVASTTQASIAAPVAQAPAVIQEPVASAPASAEVPAPADIQPEAAQPAPTASVPAASPAVPTASPVENKIHVVPPTSPAPDSQLAVSRQMASVVAEAKEALNKTLRRGALTAINEEMTVVRQQMDAQLHEAVERAIKLSMERVSESAGKKIVQQAADRTVAIVEEARKAVQSDAVHLDAKVRQAVQEAVTGAVQHASDEAARKAADINLTLSVEAAVEKALLQKQASTPSLEILSSPEAAQLHLDQWKKDLEDSAQKVRSQAIEQTEENVSAAADRLKQEIDTAVSAASQSVSEKIGEASQAALSKAEQEIAERNASVRSSLDEAIAEARNTFESLGAGLVQGREQAEETRAQLQAAAKSAAEQTQRQTEEARVRLQDAAKSAVEQTRTQTEDAKTQLQDVAKSAVEQTRLQLDDLLSAQYREAERKADELIAQRAQKIEPILQNSTEKAIQHFSEELDQKLTPKLDEVQNVISELSTLGKQVVETQADIRAQLQQAFDEASQIQNIVRGKAKEASDEAVNESLSRMREEAAKYPVEFEESCRTTLSKVEEDLDKKREQTQHLTYEALMKTADWYQKKAQAAMQAALEKSVDQSASALRERAAETSKLVSAELDHYRRTYVEHSRAEIEETAKEILDRERSQLGENAEIAAATFTDRVQHVSKDSLGRFEHASREALEKARSDMEFNREGSLNEFQKALDEKTMEGIEQARTHLQSQLVPLMEAWDAKHEVQQRQWADQLKNASDENIQLYKGRLENATNSWLLASATTLGQNSQALLDSLAQAAEKRLRETCAEVLAGMGDTLKERLLGISTQFGPDDEERRTKKRRQTDT